MKQERKRENTDSANGKSTPITVTKDKDQRAGVNQYYFITVQTSVQSLIKGDMMAG